MCGHSVVADIVFLVEVKVGLVKVSGGSQHFRLLVFVSRHKVGGELLMYHLQSKKI
jgi:hypothetical protein